MLIRAAQVAVQDCERPVKGPIYADEHIEFWARVYLSNPQLRAGGVLFETFLAAPARILYACDRRPTRAASRQIMQRRLT